MTRKKNVNCLISRSFIFPSSAIYPSMKDNYRMDLDTSRPRSPEQNLILAVIERAIRDANGDIADMDVLYREHTKNEATNWIFSDEIEEGSLCHWAELLGDLEDGLIERTRDLVKNETRFYRTGIKTPGNTRKD